MAENHKCVMVLLDSCHTESHVLAELEAYSDLVSPGSYLVVYDTSIEFAAHQNPDRPWGKGDNPYTAVQKFLKSHAEFEADAAFEQKMVLTSCLGGWIRRIR